MKKLFGAAFLLLAAGLLILTVADYDSSDACTGFYVGSDASADGNVMFGQTTDISPYYQIHYEIYEASNEPGRTIKGLSGFVYELPASTYRYTNHIADRMTVYGNTIGLYAGGGCINSQGVACTGSITGSPSTPALEADPYVKTGLGEETATSIVGACASSAREGVLLLMRIVDEQGSSESNIFIIADQKEVWYLEIYTGHQYAAVLLPTNAVIFTGNEFGLINVEDYKEYYTSKNLVSLAKDNGFDVMSGDKLDIEKTYSKGSEYGYSESCHIRSWRARNILAPSQYQVYDINQRYSLTFIPDEKVTLEKVMSVLKDRNEGTAYDVDENNNKYYCIGNYTAAESHIIQVMKGEDKDRCCIMWDEVGFPTFGVYIPYVIGVNSHIDKYSEYTDNLAEGTSMYDLTQKLFSLCSKNMTMYKDGVKKNQSELQSYIIRTFGEVWKNYLSIENKSKADSYMTDYTLSLESMAVSQTESIINDVEYWNLYSQKNSGEYNTNASFDVRSVAERYGWTVEKIDSGLMFRHDSDVVKVTIDDIYDNRFLYNSVKFDVNGTVRTVNGYVIGDSYYVASDGNIDTFTKYDAQIVPYKEQAGSSSGNDYTAVIVAVAIAAVICIIGADVLIRRHR